MSSVRFVAPLLVALTVASTAIAGIHTGLLPGNGGFSLALAGSETCPGGTCLTDYYQPAVLGQFLLQMVFMLALSAAIAFHPMRRRRKKSLASLTAPRIFLLYSLIGMAIGFLVVQYGYLIGFVVFGIGGLLRFRSTFENRADTAEVVLVTALGLCTGLNLLPIAIVIGLSAWCIIWFTDSAMGCALQIRCATDEELETQIELVQQKLAELGWKMETIEHSFERAAAELLLSISREYNIEEVREILADTLDPNQASWKVKT